MVSNLIDNAVRYNRTNGTLAASTSVQSGEAVLSIENTGPEIAASEVGRLFEPFQRLERDRTGSADHHGLGLSIVQAIAVAHDGRVTAQPGPNGGLTVEVRLPAAPASP
jgi:signal transduction histidine kinase